MIFADFPLDEAAGALLAHTLRLDGKTLKKGTVLGDAELALLRAAGLSHVSGARIEAGDLEESAGAAAIAALLPGAEVEARKPYTGRCNLHALSHGVLRIDAALVDALNELDESIAIGTLPDYSLVRPGQVVATIKIIPFAIARATVDAATKLAGGRPAVSVKPLRARRAALILGHVDWTKEKVLEQTIAVTRQRLANLNSRLALVLRCAHDTAQYELRLREALAAGCDLLLIAGATVTKDRLDIAPAAISAIGGRIEQFGLPTEPGNMTVLAYVAEKPVLVLPGCARSRRTNGLDWVLQRLHADLPVRRAEILRMGVGGLIRSPLDSDDGDDDDGEEGRAGHAAPAATRQPDSAVAVVLLAAGRSTRMGERNKLLAEVDGVPLLRRAALAACASRAASVSVVLGHQSGEAEALLADLDVKTVLNPDYAQGMATSLKAGIAALPESATAAVVMLADMPRVNADHVDALIDAFAVEKPAILLPWHGERHGNPVLWPREFFAEIDGLKGDEGARVLFQRHAGRIEKLPMDAAVLADIDTPEGLAAARGA